MARKASFVKGSPPLWVGGSRIIRYTYPDLLYTQMMSDAYPLWNALEHEAGEELFVRCGGVYFGPRDHPNIIETERSLRETGLPVEILDAQATAQRVPTLRLRDDEIALFQPDSGFLRAVHCVRANARLARSHGATLRENTPVLQVEQDAVGTLIHTAQGVERFDRAIVTAGAWLGKLFANLELPLCVTRQQFIYLQPNEKAPAFKANNFPVWIDAATHFYGFPEDGRVKGIKLAKHVPGTPTDPDHVQREPSDAETTELVQYAAKRLPDLTPEVTHAQVCLYTNTPDEDFIIDCAPNMPDVWLLSGCSGHGFKFTVLLGKIIADLATDGQYARDLTRFSLKRFKTPNH